MGREDNIANESTLAILPVCCFWFLKKSLCCLPRAGYGGGTMTMRMVVTSIKGTRGQHRRRMYVGYTSYLSAGFFGCYLFGLPHAGYVRGIMTRRMQSEDEVIAFVLAAFSRRVSRVASCECCTDTSCRNCLSLVGNQLECLFGSSRNGKGCIAPQVPQG